MKNLVISLLTAAFLIISCSKVTTPPSTTATFKAKILPSLSHVKLKTVEKAMRLGANQFITKPFDFDVLESAVAEYLAKK